MSRVDAAGPPPKKKAKPRAAPPDRRETQVRAAPPDHREPQVRAAPPDHGHLARAADDFHRALTPASKRAALTRIAGGTHAKHSGFGVDVDLSFATDALKKALLSAGRHTFSPIIDASLQK